jgi:uncharacterized protein
VKRLWLPVALVLLAGFAPRAPAQVALPKLEARVTDLTGTLTAAQQSSLEEKLAAFETRKGAQIAVLILPTTRPEDIAQFGVRLMESWKLGRKGIDDGAALIVAKDDRELRIEVQYGLEGVLTDAISSRIIYDTIVPLFKQGEFYAGINAGVDQMLRVVDGEALPAPEKSWKGRASNAPWPILVFALVFIGPFLVRLFGRVGGATLLGGIGAVVAWIVTKLWPTTLLGFVVLFVLGLMFDGKTGAARRGRAYRGGRGSDWSSWGGGGFGGGGWGGGGGGGWSGGGGMGGGGGASGRW